MPDKDSAGLQYDHNAIPLVEIVMDSVKKESEDDTTPEKRYKTINYAHSTKIINNDNFDPVSERYECQTCGRSYKHQFHLRAHFRECSNEPLFECLKCHKRFYHSRNLGRHMVNIHKEPPIKRKENIPYPSQNEK